MAGIDDADDGLRFPKQDQQRYETLIVEDDIEEGAVHVQPAVVVNKAQSAELIHEETDAGARGADHLGEHFLTDLRDHRLRLAFFPQSGPATGAFVPAASR
jgi:hypothetical protein